MTTGGWEAPISDDAAKLLLRLLGQHGPGKYDWWCRCGEFKVLCGREREFGVQLAIAGIESRTPPWAIQDQDLGRST